MFLFKITDSNCAQDPSDYKLESFNGSTVFIGSVATHIITIVQNTSAYGASRVTISSLVKPLAMELAPHNISVDSLTPGTY